MSRRARKGRNIDGILLLDKSAGITSNGALQEAKQLFKAAKAGHTGSLDPLATGILPLCFGEATKFSQFLLEANKRYLTRIKLGVTTVTGDADGEVSKVREVSTYSDKALENVLSGFRGDIEQIPSMYSAIKVGGEPLYKLARQGIEIERKKRPVSIFKLELTERETDELVLDISCSKGTYIRSLAEDIGEELGCGAHVIELKRLESGPFKLEDAVTIDRLRENYETGNLAALDKCLLPAFTAVQDWPQVEMTEVMASYLKQGQPVQVSHAPTDGWVRIFSEVDGKPCSFIGVGEILEDGRVAPRRMIATF